MECLWEQLLLSEIELETISLVIFFASPMHHCSVLLVPEWHIMCLSSLWQWPVVG
jgi:hypothetical protein